VKTREIFIHKLLGDAVLIFFDARIEQRQVGFLLVIKLVFTLAVII
jgi:hypothetical protein